MNVYDYDHKYIGNLNDLDHKMQQQLLKLNYVKRKGDNSLVWDNDIYDWDIYYEYEDGNKYKLDMKDMIIYNIEGERLGYWNEYIVDNTPITQAMIVKNKISLSIISKFRRVKKYQFGVHQ